MPVFVPIRAPDAAATSNVSAAEWKVDLDELRAAITPKTKMIWLNVRALIRSLPRLELTAGRTFADTAQPRRQGL